MVQFLTHGRECKACDKIAGQGMLVVCWSGCGSRTLTGSLSLTGRVPFTWICTRQMKRLCWRNGAQLPVQHRAVHGGLPEDHLQGHQR